MHAVNDLLPEDQRVAQTRTMDIGQLPGTIDHEMNVGIGHTEPIARIMRNRRGNSPVHCIPARGLVGITQHDIMRTWRRRRCQHGFRQQPKHPLNAGEEGAPCSRRDIHHNARARFGRLLNRLGRRPFVHQTQLIQTAACDFCGTRPSEHRSPDQAALNRSIAERLIVKHSTDQRGKLSRLMSVEQQRLIAYHLGYRAAARCQKRTACGHRFQRY